MISNADADRDVESPCVSACMVDQEHGYCVGCWRTLREISDWYKYEPSQKRALVAGLETRRATHSIID